MPSKIARAVLAHAIQWVRGRATAVVPSRGHHALNMLVPATIRTICERLLMYYQRKTRDSSLAEDIVAYAASTFLCRYPDSDPQVIFRIARNRFLNITQKNRRIRSVPSEELEWLPTPTCSIAAKEVSESLEKLPNPERRVLELLYYASQRKKEVAAALGCSVSTVKRLEGRALERLRAVLMASQE